MYIIGVAQTSTPPVFFGTRAGVDRVMLNEEASVSRGRILAHEFFTMHGYDESSDHYHDDQAGPGPGAIAQLPAGSLKVKASNSEWVGQEIAEGRYKILGRIGQGSMGHIYCAFDRHLDTDVVLKFPVSSEQSTDNRAFLDRFGTEIRSLVALSHPHIVKIIDVGEFQDLPFVVMQYLAGGILKDRIAKGPRGELEPMTLDSLQDWLPDVARALDFIHSQNHVHRDVKPANILFDRHGNAFLGDFGIIKALTSEATDWKNSSLTAPGLLVGTPNYVAPEIVMGRPADGRVDQYSLAMTVYEILTGNNCMEGPTPSATVVNQTMVVPPQLTDILPEFPKRTSDAISRGLAKNPADRFETCSVLAQEVLAEAPSGTFAHYGRTAQRAHFERRAGPGSLPVVRGNHPGRQRARRQPAALHEMPGCFVSPDPVQEYAATQAGGAPAGQCRDRVANHHRRPGRRGRARSVGGHAACPEARWQLDAPTPAGPRKQTAREARPDAPVRTGRSCFALDHGLDGPGSIPGQPLRLGLEIRGIGHPGAGGRGEPEPCPGRYSSCPR